MQFPDPRFYRSTGPVTPEEAAELIGGSLVRRGDGVISTVADLQVGGETAIVFSEDMKTEPSAAFAIIVPDNRGSEAPENIPVVFEAPSPKLAFAKISARLFDSRAEAPSADDIAEASISGSASVHSTAVIGSGAIVHDHVSVGPFAYIGPGVEVGEGSYIGAHASITHAVLGKRCRILAGARVGEAGFGYTPAENGPFHIPQLGRVILGDDVHIGAQTTIDRGTLRDTVLGPMCKIDNLCQIGHNCELGTGVVVASQTGISGSCVVGDFVMMGGQVGMADHLTIGQGALLAAGAGLMKNVEPGGKVGGIPAKPIRQWMKETAILGRLASGKK